MRRMFKGFSAYLLILILIMFAARLIGPETESISEMDVTELIEQLEENNVERINMNVRVVEGTLRDGSKFTTVLPHEIRNDFYNEYLKDKVESKELHFSGSPDVVRPWYVIYSQPC